MGIKEDLIIGEVDQDCKCLLCKELVDAAVILQDPVGPTQSTKK